MNITAYLIERELLSRRSVALPFIGTLSYERVSSRFAFDRSHLIPPQNTLSLTADSYQQGDQLIGLIASEIGSTHDEAIEVYNRWYESSIDSTGAVLTIEAVCSIDLICYAIISIDEQFSEYLMPLGDEPIAIGRPLESRGTETTFLKPESTDRIPRSQIIEELPIIEDIPYTPVAERQPNVQPQSAVQPQSPTTNRSSVQPAAYSPTVRRRQRPAGTSTAAFVGSIIIVAIAALYITYILLSEHGIINL